jgi:hypothetical protein
MKFCWGQGNKVLEEKKFSRKLLNNLEILQKKKKLESWD